jgi:hypothetical protein
MLTSATGSEHENTLTVEVLSSTLPYEKKADIL